MKRVDGPGVALRYWLTDRKLRELTRRDDVKLWLDYDDMHDETLLRVYVGVPGDLTVLYQMRLRVELEQFSDPRHAMRDLFQRIEDFLSIPDPFLTPARLTVNP